MLTTKTPDEKLLKMETGTEEGRETSTPLGGPNSKRHDQAFEKQVCLRFLSAPNLLKLFFPPFFVAKILFFFFFSLLAKFVSRSNAVVNKGKKGDFLQPGPWCFCLSLNKKSQMIE